MYGVFRTLIRVVHRKMCGFYMRMIALLLLASFYSLNGFRIQVKAPQYNFKTVQRLLPNPWETLDSTFVPLAIKAASFYEDENSEDNKFDLNAISEALFSWRSSLEKGFLPDNVAWPKEPLRSKLIECFISLRLPQLTTRHPELINDVLLGLLELQIDFEQKVADRILSVSHSSESPEEEHDDYYKWLHQSVDQDNVQEDTFSETSELQSQERQIDEFAQSLVSIMSSVWQPPLEALSLLDSVFGSDHGLMTGSSAGLMGAAIPEPTASGGGFSPFDGIWKHNGWVQCNAVLNKLRDMKELRHLIHTLGYRADVSGKDMKNFLPMSENRASPAGIIYCL